MKLRLRRKRQTDSRPPRRAGGTPSSVFTPGANLYQRSRTISATTPPASSDRQQIHHLHAHRRRLLRWLAASIIMVIIFSFLAFQLVSRVSSVAYSPEPLTPPDNGRLQATMDDYYSSRPLERLRFLLNRSTLSQFVVSKMPEVKSVTSVSSAGLGEAQITLAMRTPVASWQIGQKTLYVDSDGVAFDKNYYGSNILQVVDEGAATVAGSATITSNSEVTYLGQLIGTLAQNGTGTVTKAVIPAGMLREINLYLQGRGYYVKVQTDRAVADEAADVKAAVTYIDAHGGAKQYIDCRVSGKAFYN